MLSTLLQFTECITSFEILMQETRSDLIKIKLKTFLVDGSVIFMREIIIQNVLLDYSYHWQNNNGSLIIRFDNTAHYPNITTHPHHKHVGSETNVQASYEKTLFKVLILLRVNY